MRNAGGLRVFAPWMLVLVLVPGLLGSCTEHEGEPAAEVDAAAAVGEGESEVAAQTHEIVATTVVAGPPSPACNVSGTALYVVEAAASLSAGDAAVLVRLQALGLTVVTRSDETVIASDANGKQIIVISSSVDSTVLGPLFRSTAVPIVTWEHALFDELGMTGSTSNDNGSTTGQSRISIIDATHPLAVGLAGLLRILSGSGVVRWGRAAAGARALAKLQGDSSRDAILFADRNAAMVGGGSMPARRVGLFVDHASAQDMTPAAWLLFDSSIVWALGNGTLASRAWLVIGAGDLTAADAALRDRMESVGFSVDVVKQDALANTRMTGISLVVIAESVESTVIGNYFNDLPVPVVITEDNLTDELGMASSHGRASNQTNITITDPSSPLAAGSSGDVRVYNNGSEIMWGEPAASALVVARSKGSPTHPAIFGYETGAAMVTRVAPARRLSLFHYRGNNLTTQGGRLFEAGVTWAGAARAADICPGEVGSCARLELGAVRTYNPSGYIDATRELAAPFSLWIPPTIPVTQGNSGNGRATLYFGDSAAATLTRCSYLGSGSEAVPSTPDAIARADRYDFDSTLAGNCGGLVPGNVVSARYFRLRVEDGGNSTTSNGRTGVTLGLAGPTASSDATCNTIDEDCNGVPDDDYPVQPTSCGVGACATTGVRTCVDGSVVNTCTPGTPAPSDATCNNIDDDCDGTRDENYASLPTTCGVGACSATGATSCVGGVVQSSCHPGTPAPNDATCNNIDDDCDGTRDENYASLPTLCGVGACSATGATSCVGGVVQSSCHPGTPAPSDATCNNIDDDCDGTRDENFPPMSTTCGVGACSATGATSCVAGTVQNSCHPGTPALSDATCNNIDDDCDARVDEDYAPTPTTCGVGACTATGRLTCVNGSVVNDCTPSTPAASDTSCNGIDDDCDGHIDEDFVAAPTLCGVGACAATGVTSCVAGVVVNSCHAGTPAANDATCNGIDDDCEGHVDEDYAPPPTTCGVGACAATGVMSCVAGALVSSCHAGTPAANDASCNGIDDDCEGHIDEDYAPAPTSCGVGACAATGVTTCVAGHVESSCHPGIPAANDATCNGIDDDCEGHVDEDYAPPPTTCGVGACAATGVMSCVAGALVSSCHAGTPAANDASCNGIDDDCEGHIDEDYAPAPTSCGIGACRATGVSSCVAGHVSDSCHAGTPAANDATCNGIDDDCEGHVDEDYTPPPTTCGVGACAATGVMSCVGGALVSSCHAGTPAANDASCNGIDDDCEGHVDEDYAPAPTSCGIGACTATGSSTCVAGHVGSSCQPGTPAANDASCNGIDDDCDTQVDEDYAALPTTCGIGACAATGSSTCVAGHVGSSCQPGTPAANDATCNGVDDDCEGHIDEDFAPAPTSCGIGACTATGVTACVAGHVGDSCQPGTPAPGEAVQTIFADSLPGTPAWADFSAVELGVKFRTGAAGYVRAIRFYRGVRNDQGYSVSLWDAGGHLLATRSVDGQVQPVPGWQVITLATPIAVAANTTYTASYFTSNGSYAADHFGLMAAVSAGDLTALADGSDGDNGVYAYGGASSFPHTAFLSSSYFVDVEFSRSLAVAGDASCNGIDDDCDGSVDEDFVASSTSCGVGACAATGATRCVAGHIGDTCQAGTPGASDTTCNGIDDNCDGRVDEDFAPLPTVCGVGACTATGRLTCNFGVPSNDCHPSAPAPSDTSCNGVDDDCDGSLDEDYASLPTTCGVGSCAATGATSCVAGQVTSSCHAGTPGPSDTTCNAVDENCSGSNDEGYASQPTTCGVGACRATGNTSCVAGSVTNSCLPGTPAPSDATCNGVDENCNGTSDEGYAAQPTTCGVGACRATGVTSCVAGSVTSSCHPGTPALTDASCNGIDDDCDGQIDEDYASRHTMCGVGACAATGTTSCVAGHVVDSCQAGTPAPFDTTCNGIDDNCNGRVDEGYVAQPTTCGVGACRATGVTSCVAGSIVNSCHAGTPAASDATCNGIDDNCNGVADEDFPLQPTTCGVGACTATGRLTCVAGVPSNDCHPSAPAPNDATCNGIDDNCNGSVDEGYASLPTSCGVGACRATGVTSCAAGQVNDSCHAGTPATSDSSCNGIDDNCNGSVDEGYLAQPTACGVGACRATGATSCVAGHVGDSCHAGTPAPSDPTCDGIDDNCNGVADEDFPLLVTTCGVGVCTATGRLTCNFGVPSNDCHPSLPAADDHVCNGLDDDCDGPTDEEYAAVPTTCGVGGCARTGATSCVAGHVDDSCHAGTPAPSDASCDGIDDDCDGSADEEYLPSATSCGVGACRRTGQRICAGGGVLDTCHAGPAAPADRTCDTIDDDCDGSSDEDFLPVATTCGVGACTSMGTTSCTSGHVDDSCHAGTPQVGERCDGIDNDCDGSVDEPDGTLRWSRVSVAGPSPRWGAAMASDEARGRLILHGGRRVIGGLSAETWGWDGAHWALLATGGPPRRVDHAMAYDFDRHRVVLFGGLVDNFPDGETWEWDGATWSLLATTGPSPRYAHAMAYDPVRGVTLLFGGRDATGNRDDTWEWDGHAWTRVALGGPSPRRGHTMTTEPTSGTISLVGGYDGAVVRGDRWEWDGGAWIEAGSMGLAAREEHTVIYDEARARFVLFGGIGAFSTLLGDTRKLVAGVWTAIVASGGPSVRFLHVMGYDTFNDATLVYGGSDLQGNTFGDTWLLGERCFAP